MEKPRAWGLFDELHSLDLQKLTSGGKVLNKSRM